MTPESGDFSLRMSEKVSFFLRRSARQRDAVAVIQLERSVLEERASAQRHFEISNS